MQAPHCQGGGQRTVRSGFLLSVSVYFLFFDVWKNSFFQLFSVFHKIGCSNFSSGLSSFTCCASCTGVVLKISHLLRHPSLFFYKLFLQTYKLYDDIFVKRGEGFDDTNSGRGPSM